MGFGLWAVLPGPKRALWAHGLPLWGSLAKAHLRPCSHAAGGRGTVGKGERPRGCAHRNTVMNDCRARGSHLFAQSALFRKTAGPQILSLWEDSAKAVASLAWNASRILGTGPHTAIHVNRLFGFPLLPVHCCTTGAFPLCLLCKPSAAVIERCCQKVSAGVSLQCCETLNNG